MPLTRELKVIAHDIKDDQMKNKLRFAFASNNMEMVNQHFGSTTGFVIYAIDADTFTLIEAKTFTEKAQDGNENKLIEKLEALADCAAVYCRAVGGSAMQQLVAKGIQPVKLAEETPISQLIHDIQTEMQQGASGWLAKALRKNSPTENNRFDEMEQEGWQE